MTVKSTPPIFPVPPKEYSQKYFAELTRAFSGFVRQTLNPGEGRNTFIVLTDLQESDVGLEAGSLYRNRNMVMIALNNTSAPSGSGVSISTGFVTVTT